MNRSRTALACVEALAAQTHPPEWVVVADNVSTDDTVSVLEAITGLPFKLIVLKMPENLGNAGGVEAAIKLAFVRGADAVWILDDDSWPRKEALAALLNNPWDPDIVRHALQIDPRNKRFTWPLWVPNGDSWQLAFDQNELPAGTLIPSKSSWTGALISKEIHHQVGPVNGSLFIRGEDEEYPWRIGQAGFRFETVRCAVLDHPGPDSLVHWRLWGRNFFIERGLVDWKLYYKVRNMVWLKRRQSGRLSAISIALVYALASIWIDGPRRIQLICRAACDGWRGRLGKWDRH